MISGGPTTRGLAAAVCGVIASLWLAYPAPIQVLYAVNIGADAALVGMSVVVALRYGWQIASRRERVSSINLLRFGITMSWLGLALWGVQRSSHLHLVIAVYSPLDLVIRAQVVAAVLVAAICHHVALDRELGVPVGRTMGRLAVVVSLCAAAGLLAQVEMGGWPP